MEKTNGGGAEVNHNHTFVTVEAGTRWLERHTVHTNIVAGTSDADLVEGPRAQGDVHCVRLDKERARLHLGEDGGAPEASHRHRQDVADGHVLRSARSGRILGWT
jgi:hypothetical protein